MEKSSYFVLIFFCVTSIINILSIMIKKYLKKWGIEDCFFIFSWLSGLIYTLTTIAETGGIGIISINKNIFWVYGGLAISYYNVLWSIRLYLIYRYKKLVKNLYEEIYIKYVVIYFFTAYIGLILQFILSCVYTPGFFDNMIGKCKEMEFGIPPTQLLLNIISDLILLFLPIRIVLKSNISISHKFSLTFIFSTVVVLTIVGIMHNVKQYMKDPIGELIWATVEVNIGIIIISLPLFYKFIIKKFEKNKKNIKPYIMVDDIYELENKQIKI